MTDAAEQGSLGLREAAPLLGAYCALERRLFELTGSMAAEAEATDEARVLLDALSGEHAWHAELWADRLPIVGDLDAGSLVEVPAHAAELLDRLSFMGHLDRLAGLFRVVLPRMVATYARHLSAASPASERPTLRALRLVLRDEVEAWAGGEALLQGLLDTHEAVAAAGRVVVDLESGLAEAGAGPGLVPWRGRRA